MDRVNKIRFKLCQQKANWNSEQIFILTGNNFLFNGIYYLQKMGVTVATICIANYASVCMRKFKRPFVSFYSQI